MSGSLAALLTEVVVLGCVLQVATAQEYVTPELVESAVITPEDGSAQPRILLRYDLSSVAVPRDGVVDVRAALLCLYADVPAGIVQGEVIVWAHRVTADWNPMSVTWTGWSTPGGDFAGGCCQSIVPPGEAVPLCVDVGGAVQDWVNLGAPNHGLIIGVASVGDGWFGIATVPGRPLNPVLQIWYDIE